MPVLFIITLCAIFANYQESLAANSFTSPVVRKNLTDEIHSDNGTLTEVSEKLGRSCKGKCDSKGHDVNFSCQCNALCVEFSDCCPDYSSQCLTCRGLCVNGHSDEAPCQCNKACEKHSDCCPDFDPQNCFQDNYKDITDQELSILSEKLLELDVNNVASLVKINLQGRASYGSNADKASLPLLTVASEAYNKPTIAKLLPLLDNYVPSVAEAEVGSAQETAEETEFLNAILSTTIFTRVQDFIREKNLIPLNGRTRSETEKSFRQALHQIWFGLYTRDNGPLGSSGFEHVFLGEVKNRLVSGFHNWVFFSKQEASNRINYKGHLGKSVSLGSKGTIVKHNFDWLENRKPVSSMFVGTSPEFELGLYTLCFYARPGSSCPVKLGGHNVKIQTHYLNRRGVRYVGSAYPDL